MTDVGAPEGRGGPAWTEVWGLGHPGPAAPRVLAWIGALRARPGELLVLEQEDGPQGVRLRVLARPEVLGAGLRTSSGPTLRARPLGEGFRPSLPGALGPCVFGRLLWTAPELPPAFRGPPSAFATERAEGPADAPPYPVPLTYGRWVLQAVLRCDPVGELTAHARVLAEARELATAERLLSSVGIALASLLGARFDPWAHGSQAHRVAVEEWTLGRLDRFHSGLAPSPTPERWARVWRVPPFPGGPGAPPVLATGTRSPADANGPGALSLGTLWGAGSPVALPLASLLRHVAVVGMTGSGKTQFLAHVAAESDRRELPFVLFDLHGDLAPAVLSRLPGDRADRVVVLDATRELRDGLLGLNVLGWEDPRHLSEAEEDLLTGEVLAALRPVGGGQEEFWGPRMERFLELSIRAVLEDGGTLLEVAELLFDPLEHAAALALRVRTPAVASYLRELPSLLRRQPDLLASSQNRLARVLLSRRVASLLAQDRTPLRPEELLAEGRSLLVHVPKGALGEGPALFVANLLLARLFLGQMRGPPHAEANRPSVLFVLDEAQGFSSRLLRAIVEEGRKFGVGCVLATQSPGRLEGSLGRPPVDATGTLVALRSPPSDAERIASTAPSRAPSSPGESPLLDLRRSLSTLPSHAAWVRLDGEEGMELLRLPGPVATHPARWAEASGRSAKEFGRELPEAPGEEGAPPSGPASPATADRELLLRVARSEAMRLPLDLEEPSADRTRFASRPTRWELEGALARARSRGWVSEVKGPPLRFELADAGWARLGHREDAGAPKETAEHRRLLRVAFRLFAHRGVLLELPRQGDMGRWTPDACARLVRADAPGHPSTPAERLEMLERSRGLWLWRFTGGRDLHVEAEVHGVGRSERLERSVAKARQGRVYLLFVVGSPAHGARLRRFLAERKLGEDRARVWVLRPTSGLPPHDYSPGRDGGRREDPAAG